jgi:hypothetical protein
MKINILEEELNYNDNEDFESKLNIDGIFKFISGLINLKKFDFFGVSFNFRLENHKKYVSKTGGFWFLFYFAICSLYFFAFNI